MKIRKLLLPAVISAVLVAPAAFAQVSVGAKGGAALDVQSGPVEAQSQAGVDAKLQSDAARQAADIAKAQGGQVGDAVKDAARTGAKSAGRASTKAVDAVSGNAKAAVKASVTAGAAGDAGDEPEPEEEGDN